MSGASSANQFPTGGPFGSTDATDWGTPAQQAMRGRYNAYSAAYGPDYTPYLWPFLPAQLGGSGTAPGFREPGVAYEEPMSYGVWGRLRDSFGPSGPRSPVVPTPTPTPTPSDTLLGLIKQSADPWQTYGQMGVNEPYLSNINARFGWSPQGLAYPTQLQASPTWYNPQIVYPDVMTPNFKPSGKTS